MSVDTTWYHGRISRPDAEQRLIAHPPSKVNALHSVQTYHLPLNGFLPNTNAPRSRDVHTNLTKSPRLFIFHALFIPSCLYLP